MVGSASKDNLTGCWSWRRKLVTGIALLETLILTRQRILCAILFCCSLVIPVIAQEQTVPTLKSGTVFGTVIDVNDDVVPGAIVTLQSSDTGERSTMVSGDNGSYVFADLRPGVVYHLTISAAGFVTWTSPDIVSGPGQVQFLTDSKLQFAGGTTSVTVYAYPEQIATEQVKIEERQRVFGIIPNFLCCL